MAATDDVSNSECHETDNRLTVGQSSKWLVETLEPPDYISQTRSGPEVLLLQTQFFADWEGARGR